MKVDATCDVGVPSVQVRWVFSPEVSGRMTACAMSAWRLASLDLLADLRRAGLRGGADFGIGQEFVSLECFAMHLGKAWDLVLPFEQGGRTSAAFNGPLIDFPHGIEDRMIVGIEDVALEFGVSR